MNDKKQVYTAIWISFLLVCLPWLVQIINALLHFRLQRYGLHPLQFDGLLGILTMPLLHANWGHLLSNTPPLLLLLFGLFVFYNQKGWKILGCLYLVSGLLTWLMGRPDSNHIGASGLVYALAAFHFVSGIIRKVPRQMAFSLLVIFLYGSFVWAFFPVLYKDTDISWEGHLSGLLTGIAFAFYFRHSGPTAPVYPLIDAEKDEEQEDDENAYWKTPEINDENTDNDAQ